MTQGEPAALSEGQEHALRQLMAGMDEGGRWALLLGPGGIGKSTVLRRLLAEVEVTDADTVVCDGAEASGAERLMAVLQSQLQLPRRPAPRSLFGARVLEGLLTDLRARQKALVVLADEAHLLSQPSLALLADMAAKPVAPDPAVFVVLAGTPPLEQAALRAWGEAGGTRRAVTCRVKPFTAAEVRQYVERRMHSAGSALDLSDLAIQRIVDHTSGAPGRIDALCDQVIAHPSSRLSDHVSADTVDEAAERLGIPASPMRAAWGPLGADAVDPQEEHAWDGPSGRGWRRAGWLAGAALLAGLLVYVGPGLLGSSRDWLAGGPEALRSASGPERLGPSRPDGSRRDAVSREVSLERKRALPGAVAPGQHGAERRMSALDRAEKVASPRRSAGTSPAVAVPPSPERVAALLAGARAGQVAELARLLGSGVPANVRDAEGLTPLMLTVVNDHASAARVLLEGGALVNTRTRGGITPVMLAVIHEHPEMVKLLLERGADVNARSGTGWTALTFAAWRGDKDLVRVLLDHGADPTALDKQQWTPLDYAAWKTQLRARAPEGTDAGTAAAPDAAAHSETTFPSAPNTGR